LDIFIAEKEKVGMAYLYQGKGKNENDEKELLVDQYEQLVKIFQSKQIK
jgi:hypothetical protein